MIAEAGLAALWLAAALSLLQTMIGFGPAALRVEPRAIRAVAVTQGALTMLAMVLLIVLFARTDLSVALAKRAATRELGTRCADADGAALEAQLSAAVNQLGVGPQGLGGDSTAFAVHIELAATHITMNPIAVNMQCHSARRARASFTPAGVSYGF